LESLVVLAAKFCPKITKGINLDTIIGDICRIIPTDEKLKWRLTLRKFQHQNVIKIVVVFFLKLAAFGNM